MTRERFRLSVSVFVLVRREDEVLLIRRANTGWMDGMLSLPAGALDGQELLSEAAVRELREETGLAAAAEDLTLAHVQHNVTHGQEWLGFYFLAKAWSGNPSVQEPDKHSELVWAKMDALPQDVIPYVADAIRHVRKTEMFSHHGEWPVSGQQGNARTAA